MSLDLTVKQANPFQTTFFSLSFSRFKRISKRLLGELRRNKLDAVRVRPGGAYEKALIQFFQLRAKRL